MAPYIEVKWAYDIAGNRRLSISHCRDRMPAMKRISAISLALLLASVVVLQAADQFTGTWILNVGKSSYSPGKPPMSQTTKLETLKDGIREIVDRVNADGSKTHWDFTAKFDGKEYQIT